MARVGTFGRQPRAAPSLQATLLAIAREEENRRDQNIMDAWEHGGTFEGRPVTDQMVLAHWEDRLKGVSKDDPLYDTYKNAVSQAKYSIAASKMTARYAQGNASDGEMVRFYMGWARKVPKDSEFYRQLQRDAGQYMNRATTRAQVDTRASSEKAYFAAQDATAKKYVAPWAFLTDVLTFAAQKDGILESNFIPGEKAQDLFDLSGSDPGRLVGLINKLFGTTPGPSDGPKGRETAGARTPTTGDNEVIFVDPATGKAWTKKEVVSHWTDLNPDGGPISLGSYRRSAVTAGEGADRLIGRANRTGHATDARTHEKTREATTATRMMVGDLDITAAYAEAHRRADEVISAGRPPWEIVKAGEGYGSELLRLATQAERRGDYVLADRLRDEAEGQTGQNTLWEDLNGPAGGRGDAAETKQTIEFARASMEDVEAGSAVWVQAKMDDSGQFRPAAGGTTFMAVPIGQPLRDAAPMMKPVPIVTKDGTVQNVMVVIQTVNMLGPDGKEEPVGFVADVPMSPVGKPTRLYGYQSAVGVTPVWDDTPFWDDKATPSHIVEGRLVLEAPSNSPRFLDGQIVDSRGNVLDSKKMPDGYTVEFSPTTGAPTIKMADPMVALRATNPARFAGASASSDYGDSPSLAVAAAKAQPDANVARILFASPEASRQIDADIHLFAGDTYTDMPDESSRYTHWVPTGDQRALQLAGAQTGILVKATKNGRWGMEAINELDAAMKPFENSQRAATVAQARPDFFDERDVRPGSLNLTQLARGILSPQAYMEARARRVAAGEAGFSILGQQAAKGAAIQFGNELTIPKYTPTYEPGKTFAPTFAPAPQKQKDTVVPGQSYGPSSLSGSSGSSSSGSSSSYGLSINRVR